VRSQSLSAIIAGEISRTGPISFARFMELALYHPEAGYYASGRAPVGRGGDFYTNVSVGPVFGEILAGQFVEMWEVLGCPPDFTIVEQGANDGQLALDVLAALSQTPLRSARFAIIEPFSRLRSLQRARLEGLGVTWHCSADELSSFCGVHYSNELFDAFPVSLIRSENQVWKELRVVAAGKGFEFQSCPLPDELAAIAASFPTRPDGFTTEVRTAHREGLRTLAAKLSRGFVLAIDYGMTSEDLLAPHRSEGTLACYSRHRRDSKPLESPGEKDISAHVDFTALSADAAAAGFALAGFADQHHFLVGAASGMLRELNGCEPTRHLRKKLLQLRTLLHPESMGTQFHAILFSKGGADFARLSGFQFARDPLRVLGVGLPAGDPSDSANRRNENGARVSTSNV